MSRQYMDFVPAKSARRVVPHQRKVVPAAKKEVGTTHREVRTNERISRNVHFDTRVTPEVQLGVIEDLSPKVEQVNANAGVENKVKTTNDLGQVKAKKVGMRAKKVAAPAVEKPVEKTKKQGGEYKAPKSPFINLDKVVKRPLSKNVYRKEIKVPEEIPKGPVTLITKPEKDARIGIVVTIILTIILGAAAGTVAFLLLPK